MQFVSEIIENLEEDPTITELYLSNLGIDDETVQELVFSWFSVPEMNQNELGQYLLGPKVSSIHLANNLITSTGAMFLANLMTQLSYLDLDNNTIGDHGVELLANHFQDSQRLKILRLNNNIITNQGLISLCQQLKPDSTGLTDLFLQRNQIDDDGAQYIADHLDTFKSPLNIHLDENFISETGRKSIAEAVRHRLSNFQKTVKNGNGFQFRRHRKSARQASVKDEKLLSSSNVVQDDIQGFDDMKSLETRVQEQSGVVEENERKIRENNLMLASYGLGTVKSPGSVKSMASGQSEYLFSTAENLYTNQLRKSNDSLVPPLSWLDDPHEKEIDPFQKHLEDYDGESQDGADGESPITSTMTTTTTTTTSTSTPTGKRRTSSLYQASEKLLLQCLVDRGYTENQSMHVLQRLMETSEDPYSMSMAQEHEELMESLDRETEILTTEPEQVLSELQDQAAQQELIELERDLARLKHLHEVSAIRQSSLHEQNHNLHEKLAKRNPRGWTAEQKRNARVAATVASDSDSESSDNISQDAFADTFDLSLTQDDIELVSSKDEEEEDSDSSLELLHPQVDVSKQAWEVPDQESNQSIDEISGPASIDESEEEDMNDPFDRWMEYRTAAHQRHVHGNFNNDVELDLMDAHLMDFMNGSINEYDPEQDSVLVDFIEGYDETEAWEKEGEESEDEDGELRQNGNVIHHRRYQHRYHGYDGEYGYIDDEEEEEEDDDEDEDDEESAEDEPHVMQEPLVINLASEERPSRFGRRGKQRRRSSSKKPERKIWRPAKHFQNEAKFEFRTPGALNKSTEHQDDEEWNGYDGNSEDGDQRGLVRSKSVENQNREPRIELKRRMNRYHSDSGVLDSAENMTGGEFLISGKRHRESAVEKAAVASGALPKIVGQAPRVVSSSWNGGSFSRMMENANHVVSTRKSLDNADMFNSSNMKTPERTHSLPINMTIGSTNEKESSGKKRMSPMERKLRKRLSASPVLKPQGSIGSSPVPRFGVQSTMPPQQAKTKFFACGQRVPVDHQLFPYKRVGEGTKNCDTKSESSVSSSGTSSSGGSIEEIRDEQTLVTRSDEPDVVFLVAKQAGIFYDGDPMDMSVEENIERIPAHRKVLCARSEVFASMLGEVPSESNNWNGSQNGMSSESSIDTGLSGEYMDASSSSSSSSSAGLSEGTSSSSSSSLGGDGSFQWSESLSGEIQVPNISAYVFRQLLLYIYTGKLSLHLCSCLCELYLALDQYLFVEGANLCVKFLEEHVSMDNACQILQHVTPKILGTERLFETVFQYICRNADRILGPAGQQSAMAMSEDLVEEIISNDQLNVKEIKLFDFVVEWGTKRLIHDMKENGEWEDVTIWSSSAGGSSGGGNSLTSSKNKEVESEWSLEVKEEETVKDVLKERIEQLQRDFQESEDEEHLAVRNIHFRKALRQRIEGLLPHIRFPQMTPVELFSIVEPSGIVPADFVVEAYRCHCVPQMMTQGSDCKRMSPRIGFKIPDNVVPGECIDGGHPGNCSVWRWNITNLKHTTSFRQSEVFQVDDGTRWTLNVRIVQPDSDASSKGYISLYLGSANAEKTDVVHFALKIVNHSDNELSDFGPGGYANKAFKHAFDADKDWGLHKFKLFSECYTTPGFIEDDTLTVEVHHFGNHVPWF